ncbi:MAG: hypothetical protein ACJAWQ_001300 [Paraglaciecola sp.]|jgi:hypothetical protein
MYWLTVGKMDNKLFTIGIGSAGKVMVWASTKSSANAELIYLFCNNKY